MTTENMTIQDDARNLLLAIYKTEVDILPDAGAGTLTVRLHQLANRSNGKTELNTTRTEFPGTNLRLIYELVA